MGERLVSSGAFERDAAVVVFCRAPGVDANRWGWEGDAGLAGRSAMLVDTLRKLRQPRLPGADVLVFQQGDAGRVWEAGGRAGEGERSWQQQRGLTFAQRLEDTVARVLARGYRRVVVVGSDVPQLRASHVRKALSLLTERGVVVGGDSTGGCYLIGLQAGCAGVLRGVTWGVGRDFAALVESAGRFGGAGVLADRLHDVDRVSDVARVCTGGVGRVLRALALAAERLLGGALPKVAEEPSWHRHTEPVVVAVWALVGGHRPTGPPAA